MLNEPGMFLGVKRGLLVVYRKGEKLAEIPPPQIEQVMVTTRGASISSAAVTLLSMHNVDLIFYSRKGYPVSRLVSMRSGAVKLRRAQYALRDTERGGELARAFVLGKLFNQRTVLQRAAKSKMRSSPSTALFLKSKADEIKEVIDEVWSLEPRPCEEMRKPLMLLEARAGEAYWEGFSALVPEELGFESRKKRFERPKDPVNVMLNYCYGLLAGQVLLSLEKTGLDVYAGFLHKDSPRRPALVMDLMEEFRQPIVDKVVLKLAQGLEEDILEEGRLKREARLKLARALSERMYEKVTFSNRCTKLEYHILLQARRLAEYIAGREKVYEPFTERA